MLNQKPVANAEVSFHPVDAEGKSAPGADSYGKTNDDGYFTLKASDGRDGATVGLNHVQISQIDRERKTGSINALPPQFNKNSKLTFTVPAGGSTEANFPLSTK